MRAVLDANVIIASILSPGGTCARLVALWRAGAFEVVVSPALLAELERALEYPKLRARISADQARALVDLLARSALLVSDPHDPAARSRDAGDDYVLALAERSAAVLVTGDDDLLALTDLPVRSPAAFLGELSRAG